MKTKKVKQAKAVKERKVSGGKIHYKNLKELRDLINDKEEYRLG